MLWTPMTVKAAAIVEADYYKQIDKIGAPYICHLYAVADKQETEAGVIAGFLHDLLEDYYADNSDAQCKEIICCALGFSQEIADALCLLRHKKNEPYMDYIRRLAPNDIARKVKIADLESNMDAGRLTMVDTNTRDRLLKKYETAYDYLKGYDK